MSDVFKKFDVFLKDEKNNEEEYSLGELSEKSSQDLVSIFNDILNDLKEQDFNPNSSNLKSQDLIMADLNKMKAISQAIQLKNGTYNNLIIQEILKNLLAKMQDPNCDFSIEKQFKLLQILTDDQKEFRSVTFNPSSKNSEKESININVNNSSIQEGAKTTNIENKIFNNPNIRGIEGILESTKIIEKTLLEKMSEKEGLEELKKLEIID